MVTAANIKIIAAEPQFLIVKCAVQDLRFLIICAHAPCSEDEGVCEAWCGHLEHQIPVQEKNMKRLCLFDANSRVGSNGSEEVGKCQAEQENIPGEMFHRWLHDAQVWLPSTFDAHQRGPGHTWTHPSGKSTGRLDHIGLSKHWATTNVQTWVEHDIDIAIKRADHSAVMMSFEVTGNTQEVAPHRRPPHLSIEELRREAAKVIRSGNAPPAIQRGHLTDATWQWVQYKKALWKDLRKAQKRARDCWLQQFFDVWAGREVSSIGQGIDRSLIYLKESLKWTSRQVTRFVRNDDRQYYASLAQQAKYADQRGDRQMLWQLLKPLLPKARGRRETSTTCQQPAAGDFQQHFMELEAGRPCALHDLLQQANDHQNARLVEAPLLWYPEQLPSRQEVEHAAHRIHPNKAPGCDNLPSATMRYSTSLYSEDITKIFLKSWILGVEPLTWKGGPICPLWKGGGKPEQASNYRGITLLSVLGKQWHAVIRRKLFDHVSPEKPLGQLGGFRHQQTGFGTLFIRSFAHMARHLGLSDGCIYMDIRGAFHHMLRQMIYKGGSWPTPLVEHLAREGFPLKEIQTAARVDIASTDPGLARTVREAHSYTWAYMQGDEQNAFETLRGTRPGSPLADLAFNHLAGRLITDMHAELRAVGVLQDNEGGMPILSRPIAWVDDIAVPLVATTPQSLMDKIAAATEVMACVTERYGMRLNFKAAKTEAIANLRGPGSAKLKRELYIQGQGHLPLQPSKRVDLPTTLRIVTSYKHLGARMASECSMEVEIQTRIATARHTFRMLQKKIFGARKLSPATRLSLLEPLVLSALFHNAGFWDQLTPRQHGRLSHCTTGWQRYITGDMRKNGDSLLDASFRSKWELEDLDTRLCRSRLLALIATFQNSRNLAWEAVKQLPTEAAGTWAHQVRKAMSWVSQLDEELLPKEHLKWDYGDIEKWIATTPNLAQKIRRLSRKHTKQEAMIREAFDHHMDIHRIFLARGIQVQLPEYQGHHASQDAFECDQCARSFSSRAALSVHRWKSHSELSEERKFVFGPICPSCNVNYWTPIRMQHHLRYSRLKGSGCYYDLHSNYVPLTEPVQFTKPPSLKGVFRLPAYDTQTYHHPEV